MDEQCKHLDLGPHSRTAVKCGGCGLVIPTECAVVMVAERLKDLEKFKERMLLTYPWHDGDVNTPKPEPQAAYYYDVAMAPKRIDADGTVSRGKNLNMMYCVTADKANRIYRIITDAEKVETPEAPAPQVDWVALEKECLEAAGKAFSDQINSGASLMGISRRYQHYLQKIFGEWRRRNAR